MQTLCLALATAITLLALLTHITIGTKDNAAPILDNTTLPQDPRNTLTFSWRANSVLMFFMSIAFGLGFVSDVDILILFNALLAGGLAISALFVAVRADINPFRFPPMPLFTCIAILGIGSVAI